jgi:methionyl-tRNA formyltransferase
MKKIIYAGTPDFAVEGLKQIIDNTDYDVIAVYTQPDRPAGRGRKLTASPVKACALAHDIPVYQPSSLKSEDEQTFFASLDADLLVVTAYGLILPKAILDAPKYGCINIHASLLPRWRGAAPIQRSILAGDTETGITIMNMDIGLDTGDMLLKQSCKIGATQTASDLHDELMALGGKALLKVLPTIFDGSVVAEKQNDELALYAKKLNKAEAKINWSDDAPYIVRMVNAFNSWPVAQTTMDEKVIRIWKAEQLDETSNAESGSVIRYSKDGIVVATGKSVVNIVEMQMPGKRKMAVSDIVNSTSFDGAVFS